MELSEFWSLIDEVRTAESDCQQAVLLLKKKLCERSQEDIKSFHNHQSLLLEYSYSYLVWGAAYLIRGGCSDDAFDYFRAWLIMQGQQEFEKAVKDPDSLIDVLDEQHPQLEEFLYVAEEAYESVTGQDLVGDNITHEDLGESWDFDDPEEMKKRYPKLFAQFGE